MAPGHFRDPPGVAGSWKKSSGSGAPRPRAADGSGLMERPKSAVVEQKTLVSDHKSVVAEQKSLVRDHKSVVVEQKTLVHGHESVVVEQKSLVHDHKSVVTEQKTLVSGDEALVIGLQPVARDRQRCLRGRKKRGRAGRWRRVTPLGRGQPEPAPGVISRRAPGKGIAPERRSRRAA